MTNNTASPPNAIAQRPFQFRLVHLLIWTAIVAIFLGAVIGVRKVIQSARESARESVCRSNAHILATAILNYHDVWDDFPPVRYDDAQGKPMHSWRMLITPQLELESFFEAYRFDEPWNGPNNSMIDGPIYCFRCPNEPFSPDVPMSTNYVAVVAPGTIWVNAGSNAIQPTSSDSLMLVEIAHSNIHWMEPRDLPIEELDEWLDPKHRPRLLGNHIEGGMVAYADGSVELLSRDVTIERLRALASRAGKDDEAARETKP
jgi:hypothetical protein